LAEKLSDHGHFELEHQAEIGHVFTCLDTWLTTGKSIDVSRYREARAGGIEYDVSCQSSRTSSAIQPEFLTSPRECLTAFR
jgi:hypothetical protein